ncbi:MAG: hypothetical protein M1824_004493 [Vezdaea acicularis]|nr:MAG: hypothetical protein M1824_004493 [Vezdaea acicularis]
MLSNYAEYLGINVLNDGKLVTYRLLSRALKIHVNLAKEILFEFHQHQNAMKPASVHATYLLCGVRWQLDTNGTHSDVGKDGEDEIMQSSPFVSSSSQQEDPGDEVIPRRSVTIVREEDLESARLSVCMRDLQLLTTCNREMSLNHSNEDPLEIGKTYGIIQNANVRRRSRRKPQTLATATATAPLQQASSASSSLARKSLDATENKLGNEAHKAALTKPTAQINRRTSAPKTSSMKRDSSDIFKSFAKSKPKLKREGTDDSTASGSLAADNSLDGGSKLMSEDEDDDDDTFIPAESEVSRKEQEEARKHKLEEQEKLRKMMGDLDEAMEDADRVEQEEESPTTKPDVAKELAPSIVVSGGRRRGKRRVMKKNTIRDEEGYLVTREEAVWESFSEDEPEPPKPKKLPISSAVSGKSKKSSGKPAPGGIASFFSKK